MTYHLGINLGHDRSVAIVRDGEIIVAIQQERLDRHKHSLGVLHQAIDDPGQIQLPHEALQYCLSHCGITLVEVASITGNLPGNDVSASILRRSLGSSVASKICSVPSHHLAHAYTAYWPSGFDAALVLVADASGSTTSDHHTESYSLYVGEQGHLRPLHSVSVTAHLAALSTLGFVYEYISRKAGFVSDVGGHVSVPEAGKLMGLAPYGGAQPNWQRWLHPVPGTPDISMSAYDIFLEVAALEKRYDDGHGKPYLRPYLVDLAYKIQHELEGALLHIVGVALRETGLKKLCLAGGVALNSVANYKLYRNLGLEDIFIFPAASDCGIAAGCALWAYAQQERGTQRPVMRVATLGHTYAADIIQQAVEKYADSIQVETLDPEQVVSRSAAALAAGHILARFEGGSEFGPRALGHRSILADPTFERMKDVVNARVKFREPFRPFAPVIPVDDLAMVFEQHVPAPFMLLVSDIKPEYHAKIPAVTHCDGTGRVQTVTGQDNPYLHQLCRTLAEVRGGPPVVLNTSYNVAGQPIVETPEEAIATFLSTNIDYLCLENLWITKRHVPVLDYEQHLAQVTDGLLPQGLPPHQQPVTDLMRQLDRAMFFGETEQCPWTSAELRVLSAQGARYKETSVLFPETPYGGPAHTSLSREVVLLLDPLDNSELIDLRGTVPVSRLTFDETKWLLTTLYQPNHMESLRLHHQLTTQEAQERAIHATALLQRYGLRAAPRDTGRRQDDPLTTSCEETLAQFSTPAFSARQALAAFRQVLQSTGYTERGICGLLGIESLQRIEPTRLHYYSQYALPQTALADLIRLFQLRTALDEERIRGICGEGAFDTLCRLGLFIPRGTQWASRVDLYCVDDLFIATDHRYLLLTEDQITEQPVMYIGMDSHGLVHTAPRLAVERVLDLCTGSGVQALVASRYAGDVVGVDLNPRALRFARFNAQLNGIDNVRFIAGDLYAAVTNEKFDIILANPPFVPSPHSEESLLRFRDGGTQGEAILARIIAEADEHLTANGRLHIVTDLVDLPRYQDKLNTWWQGGAVDILVLHTADRDEALFSVPHSHWPFGQTYEEYTAELDRWITNFRSAGLSAVNFGYILLRRRPDNLTSSYFARCIHNPSTPIHTQVGNYFNQRDQLTRLGEAPLYLDVIADLRVRRDRGMIEDRERVELYVDHNPYYTTYLIDEALWLEIQMIAKRRPLADQYIHSNNRDWVEDLIGRGILQLARGQRLIQEHRRTRATSRDSGLVRLPGATSASEPHVNGKATVIELSTKTTPTCLSAYLRR